MLHTNPQASNKILESNFKSAVKWNQLNIENLVAFLDRGISPHSLIDGIPLFYKLVSINEFALARKLLEYGVDPNMEFRNIPIIFTVVDHVSSFYDYDNPAISGVLNNIKTQGLLFVEDLLKYGADINDQEKNNGMTPLMRVAQHQDLELIFFLLKLGADVSITDASGHDVMAYTSDPKIKKMLLVEYLRHNKQFPSYISMIPRDLVDLIVNQFMN